MDMPGINLTTSNMKKSLSDIDNDIEQCISFIFVHASKNLISKMAVLAKPPANYVRNFPAPGDPNLKDLRISVRPGGWRKCFHLLQLFAGFNSQTLW
jgi:hypothetical protein